MGDQTPDKDKGKDERAAAKANDAPGKDAKPDKKKTVSGSEAKGGKKPEKAKKAQPDGKKSSGGFSVLLGAVVFFIAVVLVGQFVLGPKQDVKNAGSPAISIGGPFSLTDQDGNPVTERNFRDRFMLVYFGYTFCSEICLTSLSNMSEALEILGDAGASVVPVFITVDPERDTPEDLKEFISYFHPRTVGLTGSSEQISATAKAFQIYYKKVQQAGAEAGDYQLDHTSIIYLMGPDGVFRVHFTNDSTPEKMAERIREFL